MTKTADVVAGQMLDPAWGNEVRDRAIQIFASVAERDGQWINPPNGTTCITTDTNTRWTRFSGAWYAMPESGLGVVLAIGNFNGGADANLSTTPGTPIPVNIQYNRNCPAGAGGTRVKVTQNGDYEQVLSTQIYNGVSGAIHTIEARCVCYRSGSAISTWTETHTLATGVGWNIFTMHKFWWSLLANDELEWQASADVTGLNFAGSRQNWKIQRLSAGI